MSEVQHDLSVSALVHAIEANMFEFTLLLRRYPRAEVYIDEEMIWTISDIPFPLFNVVLRAKLAPGNIDAAIETAISRCKSRNVPMTWRIGPTTRPADLGVSLEAQGFNYAGGMPGMAVDLQSLNESVSTPSGLTVERVKNIEALKKWRHVFAAGFGMPDFVADELFDFIGSLGFNAQLPLRNYIGLLEGEPVASSSALLRAGVAGIYNVATLPEARRQGIGSLMTLVPLREARTMGYRIGILHSSEMGVNVYRQLGFQQYCTVDDYVWSP